MAPISFSDCRHKARKSQQFISELDGERVFVPGIMELVERTGVHSGDSISVYPPYSLSAGVKKTILDYTERLGLGIGIREGRFCENCGAPLQYDFYHFSQLGVYRCPSCGFERPEIDYDASKVRLSPQLSFDIQKAESAPVRIAAPMTGFYNVYNILAVCSVLREMGIPTDRFDEVLRGFKPQFGRGEVFHIGDNNKQRVLLNLAHPFHFPIPIQQFSVCVVLWRI